MDTKKLAALAAAVRLGSFTRAAEELGYTQSGLTHMMNSLEKDVGFPVLVRSRSGVRLTPASPSSASGHGRTTSTTPKIWPSSPDGGTAASATTSISSAATIPMRRLWCSPIPTTPA